MRFSISSLLQRLLGLIELAPASDRWLLRLALFALIASGVWLALAVNEQYITETAIPGGSYTEGVLGTPRFVNPALALTRADQDLTALVYSGLMRIGPGGNLENDLAETIDVSEDGRTYTITLRRDVKFHDGTPVTARDVVYTYQLIQDPDLKSPLRGNWTDVTVTEVNEYELTVTLEEAYAPFAENFTTGIMPAHAWSSLPTEQIPFSQLNTEPIGTGPFAVSRAVHDTSGVITHYELTAFSQPHRPVRIDAIDLRFYSNEDSLAESLQQGDVDATAYLKPSVARSLNNSFELYQEPLPRTFSVFFNQNRSSVLREEAVREALAVALDREALVEAAVSGLGFPNARPTPLSTSTLESENGITSTSSPTSTATQILQAAEWELTNGRWEKTIDGSTETLDLTVRTGNSPLFTALIDELARQWETIGVDVITEKYEQTGLVQSVIRPRDFQVLLYGTDLSRSYDLYPFWHSSQQDDPGLNIAQYTNITVDDQLETARISQDTASRTAALRTAEQIILEERPALFLFQPALIYVTTPDLTVTPVTRVGRPSDRFARVHDWHIEREELWPWFQNRLP